MIFPKCPMNHFLPNPLKHQEMTFGVLRISSHHCARIIWIKHFWEVDSGTLLLHTYIILECYFLSFLQSPTKSPKSLNLKTAQKCPFCFLHISMIKKV